VVTALTLRDTTVAAARAAVAGVPDPEVPVLTIDDLGVLRDVEIDEAGTVRVTITPTYSGCPAMDVIRDDVRVALRAAGFERTEIITVLSPAWTTDWMSAAGKAKLRAYGIAPPPGTARAGQPISLTLSVRCPQCDSLDTREISRFGSTACKSLWVCNTCAEPFDHFKAI
jgi:ring-1,2-phenylacetyl-CoA epoxidase subunit PaaD